MRTLVQIYERSRTNNSFFFREATEIFKLSTVSRNYSLSNCKAVEVVYITWLKISLPFDSFIRSTNPILRKLVSVFQLCRNIVKDGSQPRQHHFLAQPMGIIIWEKFAFSLLLTKNRNLNLRNEALFHFHVNGSSFCSLHCELCILIKSRLVLNPMSSSCVQSKKRLDLVKKSPTNLQSKTLLNFWLCGN